MKHKNREIMDKLIVSVSLIFGGYGPLVGGCTAIDVIEKAKEFTCKKLGITSDVGEVEN